MEKTILKTEERKSRQEIVEFLREIIPKIESGQLTLKKGEEEVVLQFPETNLELEIKVEEKIKPDRPKKFQLEIEIEWVEGEEEGHIEVV